MNFAIIGAAGYVAPRHMEAIKSVKGNIVAVLDPSDSVGVLDRYGFDTAYFREFERFDRYAEKLRRADKGIDYVVVCSPNYLHDSHIRFGLRIGANVICEKPLVINPWNLDAIQEIESTSSGKVYVVLQLRSHKSVIQLKETVKMQNHISKADLVYTTPRGQWYKQSWKGNEEKSGGVLMNIGIHLFDMLIWVYGAPKGMHLQYLTEEGSKGSLEFEKAEVSWMLSTHKERAIGRVLSIDPPQGHHRCNRIDFTSGFDKLHNKVYQDIVNGKGWGIGHARPAIQLVSELRVSKIIDLQNS